MARATATPPAKVTNPRVLPGSRIAVLPGEAVYLFAPRGTFALRGSLYERLVPLLDGTRRTADLVDALSATDPAADVCFALDQLIGRGYVCEGGTAPAAEAGFWSALGLDPSDTARRLQATSVEVVGIGRVDLESLNTALTGTGLTSAPDGALMMVVTDDYLRPELAALNARALSSGRPWLLCKPTGGILWIGPLFRPGHSACWECLAQRLRRHRSVEAEVQARVGGSGPLVLPRAAVPASESVAHGLAALHLARTLASGSGASGEGEATLLTLDLETLATDRHIVTRRPQCAQCGARGDVRVTPPPLHLEAPSASRAAEPDATFARYRHHVSPITGLVSELSAVTTRRPSPIHVWRANGGTAWGKGPTAAQARTAALCEALEMASGRFQGDEPCVRASYRSLGDRAIHPNACLLFSERQYATREAWNAAAGWFRHIPEPFDEEAEIDWVHVWSLTRAAFRLLPAEYCYYGRQGRPAHCPADPNGQGAGNTMQEAVLHGLVELVERDATAIWWANRLRRPGIDLEGVDDPFVQAVRADAADDGRELWALDLTHDLGIPVVAAVTRAAEGPERISFGFGAGLDPRDALVHAIAEVHQLAATLTDAKDPWMRRWRETAILADHPYLAPEGRAGSWVEAHANVPDDRAPMAAIAECRRRLERHGLEVLVLDQTRSDIGLPTARVIVPGLCHWRPPRHAPGRLYDVPVRLGWLAAPLPEDRLNPLCPPA